VISPARAWLLTDIAKPADKIERTKERAWRTDGLFIGNLLAAHHAMPA
jgi:hypothetical protein